MTGIEISEVDVRDERRLRAFWDIEQAAIRADREHAIIRSWDAFRTSVTDPSPYYGRILLVALDDEEVVGVADARLPLQENKHLAELEINVVPASRRRGVGRSLYADALARLEPRGRRTMVGEVTEVPGLATAGVPFARALGFETVHLEDHLRLPLPTTRLPAPPPGEEYEIVTWRNRCPDEHAEAYCAMRTQMNADVPTGDRDAEPVVMDVQRLRTQESRLGLRAYDHLVAAARRREDGVFGGYSLVFRARGETYAQQDDTFVMSEHRGRRLGTLLKLTNLRRVEAERPERVAIHTWTDPDNTAMRRTNDAFGFVTVERTHEMQRRT